MQYKVGDKINNWTILDNDFIIKHKTKYYKVRCDCGNMAVKSIYEIKKVKKCLKCNWNKYIEYDDYVECFDLNDSRFIVSKDDFERIKQYKWYVRKDTNRVVTNINYKKVSLHRFLMQPENSKIHVDHINRDPTDNRRENLRLATNKQNSYNKVSYSKGISKYKGVSFSKSNNKWRAMIHYNYKSLHLGYYINEIDAAKAYNKKAQELFGEFAFLNEF